jgi:hypothetical protein
MEEKVGEKSEGAGRLGGHSQFCHVNTIAEFSEYLQCHDVGIYTDTLNSCERSTHGPYIRDLTENS